MDWVERFPERFQYELADFARHGLVFELDAQLLRRERRVVMRGEIEVEGEAVPIRLVVAYPDAFPYFRPEVYAPDLRLPRHQNPIDSNLCLLDRSTRAWNPSETAAHLVATQVPYLLGLLRQGGEAMREGEVPQGEPVSYFFPPLPGTVVFVPEQLLHLPREQRSGIARLAFAESEPPAVRIRALLQSAAVRERRGRTRSLGKASRELQRCFGGSTVEARWVRLDHPPTTRDPEHVLAIAEQEAPGISNDAWQPVRDGAVAVTGLVFREEISQGEWGETWLFVVKFRKQEGHALREGWYLTRGERLSTADMQARIPKLEPLAGKTVALIGLGALGAPIAIELVRAQLGQLRLLDFDLVEVATTVRWPYGLAAVAAPKPEFLQQVLAREYPFTEVIAFNQMLGQVPQEHRETDFDLLARMFNGVDLVIDATAEIGVQQFVAALADERELPQVYVWATEGARGGAVARSMPGATGCWHCLQLAFDRGLIELPPRDETGTVQPRGCASRTFAGAAFDLLPIAAQAVRAAVSTLVAARQDEEGDVFVASLPSGICAVPPAWKSMPLVRQIGCPGCSEAQAAA